MSSWDDEDGNAHYESDDNPPVGLIGLALLGIFLVGVVIGWALYLWLASF